jgi:hypothetical protein
LSSPPTCHRRTKIRQALAIEGKPSLGTLP